MHENRPTFLSRAYLRSQWNPDWLAFRDSPEETALRDRLVRWSQRADLGERAAEAAFLDEFFHRTWGYVQAGQEGGETTFGLYPQFPVPGAGPGGGTGLADAALGRFDAAKGSHIPQAVAEFKNIRTDLDAPQRRKGGARSPVRQALDYLAGARRGLFGCEPVLPMWAIVTDMNEFRLYWHDRGDRQFMRFAIRRTTLFDGATLLDEGEDARFDRFLFLRVFHRETLIAGDVGGRPLLFHLIRQQRFSQRELENTFYGEYRDYRDFLWRELLRCNDETCERFPGTRGRLVRLAQKLIDRCIFVFFCEDMGRVLGFPPRLLGNFLAARADDPYFDPQGDTIWQELKALFRAMNDGSAFGGETLNPFNGGLFAPDPDLDRLRIPNLAFCEKGQGQNEDSLRGAKRTLLYLSAAWNYASGWADGLAPDGRDGAGDPTRSLGLYTLGRIFEQSVTELEILEAEADGRPSLNALSKRKREGVYYTPEWAVERIVAETIGRRLADLKRECGWPAPDEDRLPDEAAIDAYDAALREVRVVDPACGSGAFLIASLRFLLEEWRALLGLRRQVSRDYTVREGSTDDLVRDLLRKNIYGVDINPASVEIARLALWLHTARGDRPLSSLDEHVREGNSLIGPEFYEGLAPYDARERERVNAFDWRRAFPEVFGERGGFDAAVGNPPYVKLQNFRRVHGDMADFLQRPPDRGGRYASTQTGAFDLYLPFIEKGLELLNEAGQLGFIAPSLWTVNDYGRGLRRHVAAGRHLRGWIDFGSHQVFDEATTYTALQFFSRAPNDSVSIASAHDGVVPADPWRGAGGNLTYDRLAFGNRWLLATGADRGLIDRLAERCRRLDDRHVTRNIFVGVQTSADAIFHLRKVAPGRYECRPGGAAAREVRIEDALMKPLVSGAGARRYEEPATDTYLLFPYEVGDGRAALMPADRLASDYPLAWNYLRSWETELRGRENGKMDRDDRWWGYIYPKNLDKQEIGKLIVAQTVPSLRLCNDSAARFWLNNVRVNGVVPAHGIDSWYLLGVLNGRVCDWVFRRIAKPKAGGWFEANRQFIAPLPVPEAGPEAMRAVAERARELQTLHTRRRDLLEGVARRRSALTHKDRPESWLFPGLPDLADLEARSPEGLDARRRKGWARRRLDEELAARRQRLGARLAPGVDLSAELADSELRFLVDGAVAADRIFVDDEEGPFLAAQWKALAASMTVTASTDGRKLSSALRRLAVAGDNPAAASQIVELERELGAVEARIADAESETNRLLYDLYDLDADEIRRIENDDDART